MITAENLNFDYPGKRILHEVSFSLPQGSITALVGPNGAGKTTLLRCLAALDIAYSGKVTIDGMDVMEEPRNVHRVCGYLSDFFGLYDALTVRQCLTYAGWCHNISAADIPARVEKIARQTGITEFMNKSAGVLSRGYRQRLGIGLAMIHDPKVLLLDEPASGMDPESRVGLSAMMQSLRDQGKTIVVSSHILNELEDYCTDMLVIRDGRIADYVRLKDYAARQSRLLRIGFTGDAVSYLAQVAAFPHVSGTRIKGNEIVCDFSGDAAAQQKMLLDMIAAKIPVSSLSSDAHTLQDAYMDSAAGKTGKQP
jgi:ABC-2 type transport system ATP-binding protein